MAKLHNIIGQDGVPTMRRNGGILCKEGHMENAFGCRRDRSRRTALLACFTFLLAPTCLAQVAPTASKVADKWLKGLQLRDLSEGKNMMKQTELRAQAGYSGYRAAKGEGGYPTLRKISNLFESMFDTDIPEIRGYKRLVDVDILNEDGGTFSRRYLLICFIDKKSRTWKVLDFLESTDLDQLAAKYEARYLHDSNYGSIQSNYLNYGIVLLNAGRLKQATQAFQEAIRLNTQEPEGGFRQTLVEDYLDAIQRITGKGQ